jgi:hypothetical protein
MAHLSRLEVILLGRLQMSIDEAIEEYIGIIKEVFQDPKPHSSSGYVFSASKLEMCMEKVVRRYANDGKNRMVSVHQDRRCKV